MHRVLQFSLLALCFASPLPMRAQEIGGELEAVLGRLEALERETAELRHHTMQRLPADPYGAVYLSDEEQPATENEELAKRVEALESELKEQAEAAEKKAATDAKKPTQRWTGRVQADYWAFPHTSPGANAFENGDADLSVEDRFLFRRVRIGLQGDIPDNMFYKLEVDFNNPNSPQLKDNYIGWRELPLLQELQFGNQKRPYSLDQINSSRYNVFMERPAVADAFNPDTRRIGVCAYGFTEDLAFNWRYGAFMSQDVQNIGTVLATPVLEEYQAEFAARLANTIWYDEASGGRGHAHWGIAGTTASTDPSGIPESTARFASRVEARTSQRWLDTGIIDGADHYNLLGLEGLLNLGAVQCVGEVQQVWMDRIADPDLVFHGGYVYVAYFLTGESMAWDRETGQLDRVQPFENFWLVDTCHDGVAAGWGAWQVAARYSRLDLSDEDIDGGIENEFTLGLNWYWNAYSKMQFSAIYGEIADRRPVDGFSDAHYTILGTRFLVDF